MSSLEREMVGQQLQRDNVDDRLNGAVQPRYPDDRILALDNVTDLLVVVVRHDFKDRISFGKTLWAKAGEGSCRRESKQSH